MVKLIGQRRLISLSVLLAINNILIVVLFLWAQPLRVNMETRIVLTDKSITGLRSSILNIKNELREYKINAPFHEILVKMGLFQKQDRFLIRTQLEDIKDTINAPSFAYAIKPVVVIDNADAEKAGYQLTQSQISISKIKAQSDVEIFALLDAINSKFSGQTRIESFSISRSKDVTNALLEQLRAGDRPSLVQATIVFDWQTLAPIIDEEASEDDYLRR